MNTKDLPEWVGCLKQSEIFVSHLRTSMKLTDNELALLADSIFWEMTFLEKKGWHTSQRAIILTDLQNRIHAYLDSQK